MNHGIISIFGGSSPRPGTPAYEEAYTVGKVLAEAGYTVATGGYTGIMEAASKGAAEAGGHVIGVTTDALNRWEAKANCVNQWVKEEIKFATLSERLYHLVTFSHAVVVLGGGIGTLSELALAWSLVQVGEIAPKPLVLVGPAWRDWLAAFYGDGAYIRQEDMALLHHAFTPSDIVAALRNGDGPA